MCLYPDLNLEEAYLCRSGLGINAFESETSATRQKKKTSFKKIFNQRKDVMHKM
jgi:hypothetical protein